ncbi:MAG: divalent-cation tolerance protein CutA [Desulfovibrio sp.]|nr:divalent-cation tolerance protein CutA [Desulfovibrio sp.]
MKSQTGRVELADKLFLVYMTCPDFAVARSIGRELVENGLAAGINIVPGAISIYRWRGEIRERAECLLFAQIADGAFDSLVRVARASHPDIVPCVLAFSISGGLSEFLRWIEDNGGTG